MSLFGRAKKAPRGAPTYWNESVVERIQRDAGADRDTAAAWWNEMLIFLDMAADSKDFISPPERVDVAWHAFILHTRDYEEYCRARYGRVIHHQPTGAADVEAYRRAYELRSDYGSADNSIWPVPAGVAAGAAVGEQVQPEGAANVGPAVEDAGSGSGGGFFSNLFGGGDSGGSGGDSGGSGGSGGGDGGGSSCGGGGGGGSS